MMTTIYFNISLYFSTLLAATILPFSSEVIFSSALLLDYNPMNLLVIASLGNCTGVTINYLMGMYGADYFIRKREVLSEEKLEYFAQKYKKYNNAIFFLAWLPIIGDPITIYAGVLKLKFSHFALYVYTLRVLRYIAVYYMTINALEFF